MKIKTSFFLPVLLVLALTSFQKVHSTTVEYDGDPSENPNHFAWTLMSELQVPDDPDCHDIAMTALEGADLGEGGPSADEIATGACNGMAQMKDSMQAGMGHGEQSTETNLFDAADWHNVSNLYFRHSTNGVVDGLISFSEPIDFMSYSFMHFMKHFGEEMDAHQGYLSLDASTVGGFADYGASLTMYNLPSYDNPEILVNGGADTGGVVSNLVYDKDAGTVTFSAAHFTSFEVSETATSVQKAHIDSWSAYQYTNQNSCAQRLKVTIKGKHFDDDAEVKIGNKKAASVKRKSSRKLVATFCLTKLLDIQTSHKRSIKVINPDADTEKADKKIDLDKIDYKLSSSGFGQSTPEGVKNVQLALIKLGYLDSQYATGIYGSLTMAAVQKFQADNGLPQTGFVGPLTSAKLAEKLK